jgi:16S rRNA (guanine966-N2)-methyltransferase
MRVIAGSARGRRIVAPPGFDVRPTSDRVRQATFNALTHRGAVDGARVVDLFAGSGALGIEALSRGADHVTFVESDRTAHQCILGNIEYLGFQEQASVVRSDAPRWAQTMTGEVDLVFADPPYQFDGWVPLLASILPHLANDDSIVVMETGNVPELGEEWTVLRQQRYSATVMTLLARTPADFSAASPSSLSSPPSLSLSSTFSTVAPAASPESPDA